MKKTVKEKSDIPQKSTSKLPNQEILKLQNIILKTENKVIKTETEVLKVKNKVVQADTKIFKLERKVSKLQAEKEDMKFQSYEEAMRRIRKKEE